jgi:hypothetical protein
LMYSQVLMKLRFWLVLLMMQKKFRPMEYTWTVLNILPCFMTTKPSMVKRWLWDSFDFLFLMMWLNQILIM